MKALASGSEAMCSATDLLCARILDLRATIPAAGSPIDRELPQPLVFCWTGPMTSALVEVGSAGVMKDDEVIRRLYTSRLDGLS